MVWLEHIAIGPPFLSSACELYVPDCRILTHPGDVRGVTEAGIGCGHGMAVCAGIGRWRD